ncbi:MAG: hypothetical protein H6681_04145 [Desulfobacteraceae bacterium]|nr:hypothetical protein [Desulfobacteraceae bacterium]MCB9494619.1 hypothetical protein [Desulfobacteraceae bacterium]
MIVLKNENGAAMFIVVMMLILLSIIGFAAINDSFFNLDMSSNLRKSSQDSYICESLAIQGAQIIDSVNGDILRDYEIEWLYDSETIKTLLGWRKTRKAKFFSDEDIDKVFSPPDGVTINYKIISDANSKNRGRIIAFYNGLSDSGSQDMGSSDSIHEYTIFARYETFREIEKVNLESVNTVEIGYRRKF